MNNITIAGQLGRDAELRYLPNGDAVCGFSVADSMGKDKPTIWWSCQLFGKRAETLSQYLTKGQKVTVAGSVSEREWTDKNGEKKKSLDVRVSDVSLQGERKESAAPIRQNNSEPPRQTQQRASSQQQGSGFDDMDDSIPF